MVKIKGLDSLQRKLKDTSRALEALNGELGTVQFDPHDPGSIEAAIQYVSTVIDKKVGGNLSNPITTSLAEELKKSYRESIIKKAAEARLKGGA